MLGLRLGDKDPNVARVLGGDDHVAGGDVRRLGRAVGRVLRVQPVSLHLEEDYLRVRRERGQRNSAGHGW